MMIKIRLIDACKESVILEEVTEETSESEQKRFALREALHVNSRPADNREW